MDHLGPQTRRYPFALWTYFVLLFLLVVDALLFSSVTISVSPVTVAFIGLLILGLLAGSRVCRWLLIIFSLATALGTLVVKAGAGDFADAMLVVIPLGQAAALFSPSLRAFTASHPSG